MADPAPRLTKAQVIAQKAARARLEEEHAALLAKRLEEEQEFAARLDALNVGAPLQSTMERSLDQNLAIEHALVKTEVEEFFDDDEALAQFDYDDDDLIDADFWESGVVEPKDVSEIVPNLQKLTAADAPKLLAYSKKWIAAYRALDVKFCKRATLAHELKRVYAKKRDQLKVHRAIASSSSAAALKSEARASAAVAVIARVRAIAEKPCGCKTKCPPSCGCRKKDAKCSPQCGCKCIDCLNPNNYDDSDEGKAAALASESARMERAKQYAALKKEAARQAAIESGQMDNLMKQ